MHSRSVFSIDGLEEVNVVLVPVSHDKEPSAIVKREKGKVTLRGGRLEGEGRERLRGYLERRLESTMTTTTTVMKS